VYNFNDCDPEFGAGLSEVLALLAASSGRGDWMAVARAHPAETMLYLAYDDPAIADTPLPRAVAAFPTAGAATMRAARTFVGLKSGPAQAGHSHLDANSFVIEAGGAPLVHDYRYWPQAHFLGYFDGGGPRWHFDGLATIGHSTLLVDGKGQAYADGCGGRIVEASDHGEWARLVGDAAGAYPGLLTQFTRTVLLLKPDVIVIRDRVACAGERDLEWLLHHAGTVTSRGRDSIIEHQGVRLAVTPFLPDRALGWRVSDVMRTSTYECSDTRQEVTMAIRYRGFSAFRPAHEAEFLFGLRVNGAGSADWTFAQTEEGWTLRAAGYAGGIVPEGEMLAYRER
ncbi:MAG TPA: heparinase II/III family protein, partial [Armatimonadota bacterium]|nr:heparinase II/III family protein [Armatimonadota bacterium]